MKRFILAALLLCPSIVFPQGAALSPVPKIQFLDNNGKPLGNGYLYTYSAGTTTLLPTYTDASGTTQNTDPVRLDSGGFANIWLGNDSYRMVLQDSKGATIWTVDNVQNTGQIQIACAGTPNCFVKLDANGFVPQENLNYVQGGTASVNRTVQNRLQDIVSVKDFGAKGDGATNDAAAFQAALNYAGTFSQGAGVFIPDGKYIIGTTLVPSASTTIYGMGRGSWVEFTGTGSLFKYSQSGQASLVWRDLFLSTHAATATAAIELDNTVGVLIDNLFIDGFNLGFSTAGIWINTANGVGNLNTYQIVVQNTVVTADTGDGILVNGNAGMNASKFTGNQLQSNGGIGLNITPTAISFGNTFIGNLSEANTIAQMQFDDVRGSTIAGNYLEPNSTDTNVPMLVGNNVACLGLTISGNELFFAHAPYAIDLNGATGSEGISIVGNDFAGITGFAVSQVRMTNTLRSRIANNVNTASAVPTITLGANAQGIWIEDKDPSGRGNSRYVSGASGVAPNLEVDGVIKIGGSSTSNASLKDGGTVGLLVEDATGASFHPIIASAIKLGTASAAYNNYTATLNGTVEQVNTGNTPTVSSCGTSPAIQGTDFAGLVVTGTSGGTSCVVTFHNPHVTGAYCTVTDQSNFTLLKSLATKTALTITASSTLPDNEAITYHCVGF